MAKISLTPLKAIRRKCLDCCCDNGQEVRQCAVTQCPCPFAPAPPHKTKEANMKKQEIDECCTMLTACIVRQLKALSLEELREAYTAVCKITDKKKPDLQ